MGGQDSTAEEKLARIAGRAHGIVTRVEALRAGVTGRQLERRVRKGSLIPEHPGVYRVGHRAGSTEAHYMAAVKACGEGALLCGRPAAYLFGLLKGSAPPPEVMTRTWRRVPGIRTRRCRNIHTLDASTFRGIPITTVPRTLVDLAADLPLNQLSRAFHEAGVRGLKPKQVEAVLARRPNSPGAGKLRAAMYGELPVTLSYLENAFLTQLKNAGLPLPQTNRSAGSHYVDCRWPEHRLTVELDSYRYHHTRHAWEQDHRRKRAARARGDDFRSYTYGDVCEDSALMLSELRALLRK